MVFKLIPHSILPLLIIGSIVMSTETFYMLTQQTLPAESDRHNTDVRKPRPGGSWFLFSLDSRVLFMSPLNRHSHRRWLRCYITARLCWSCNSCWRTVFVAKQAPETRMEPTAQGRRGTKRTKVMRGSRGFTVGKSPSHVPAKTLLETRNLLDLDYYLLSRQR